MLRVKNLGKYPVRIGVDPDHPGIFIFVLEPGEEKPVDASVVIAKSEGGVSTVSIQEGVQ